MRRSCLMVLFAVAACGSDEHVASEGARDAAVDAASDGGEPPADADVSDASEPEPLFERRDEPRCIELEGAAHAFGSADIELESDFVHECDYGRARPDLAYAWTAPEDGLYGFWLGTANDCSDVIADVALHVGTRCDELRAEDTGQCAPRRPDAFCGLRAKTLLLEAGTPVTVVVEGDYVRAGPTVIDMSAISRFEIAPVACPTELQQGAPLLATLGLGMPPFRDAGCTGADDGSRAQAAIGWRAPSAATFRFELERIEGEWPGYALAVLADSCLGEVLACERGDSAASVSVELSQDQAVVIVAEGPAYSSIEEFPASASVRLRVSEQR